MVELILGVALTIFLLGSYTDPQTPRKFFVEYLTSDRLLQFLITIGIILLASRLIAGKPKDYSRFFYKLLVKIWGDPKKGRKD